jgi:excinuclease UvrABC nuclease subunit
MPPYDIDFTEEAIIKDHIKKFLLYPRFWMDHKNQINITLKWRYEVFLPNRLNKIPRKSGIYAFVLRPRYQNLFPTSYLFYVGKTNRTLKERFREYIDEKNGKGKPRKKVHKMLNQYENYLIFYYAEIPMGKSVNKSERSLLNTFVPHINVSIPKAKIKKELQYIYEQN